MRRRAINLLAVLSLVLCAAVSLLWIRSYRVQDTFYVHRSNVNRQRFYMVDHRLYSVRGQLVWKIATYNQPPWFAQAESRSRAENGLKDFSYDTTRTDQFYFNPAGPTDPWWMRLGFRYSHSTFGRSSPFVMTVGFYEMGLPYWLFAVLTALLPATWITAVLRRRRGNRCGLCPSCGYDLRATPDRCPECGTVVRTPISD